MATIEAQVDPKQLGRAVDPITQFSIPTPFHLLTYSIEDKFSKSLSSVLTNKHGLSFSVVTLKKALLRFVFKTKDATMLAATCATTRTFSNSDILSVPNSLFVMANERTVGVAYEHDMTPSLGLSLQIVPISATAVEPKFHIEAKDCVVSLILYVTFDGPISMHINLK